MKTKENSTLLFVSCLGVVYGDIGTSPIYAFRECMISMGGAGHQDVILGILSTIIWSLIVVVSVKYLLLITRANNDGEGGIFAMWGLLSKHYSQTNKSIPITALLVLLGASLLYGDGIITPAISILSASEGLEELWPGFHGCSVPITCCIMIVLFMIQKLGSGRIGLFFGWIMLIWFLSIGSIGLYHIFYYPYVLASFNPWFSIHFFATHPDKVFLILSSVVLTFTGAEALYADMGHFGRGSIAKGWFFIVVPSLILNYLGQGAFTMNHGISDGYQPFYQMAPTIYIQWGLVMLSFFATIIASQALISGIFSLTRQAMVLGYLPRLQVIHTSDKMEGQIYVPTINFLLCAGCLLLVLLFQESSALASAYGTAVTGTMLLTQVVFLAVMIKVWKWSIKFSLVVFLPIFLLDILFFSSCLNKLYDGGWIALVVALVVLTIMHTWRTVRSELRAELEKRSVTWDVFLDDSMLDKIYRAPGTAVFMAGHPDNVPLTLLHHIKINHCLCERIYILSFIARPIPHVTGNDYQIIERKNNIWSIMVDTGYLDICDATKVMSEISKMHETNLTPMTYFFSQEKISIKPQSFLSTARKRLYSCISENSQNVYEYFNVPSHQIVLFGLLIRV